MPSPLLPALAVLAPAAALLALAVLAAPATAGPRDPLYRWTDEEGAVRYTTERQRIPRALRDRATVVDPETEATPPAQAAPVPDETTGEPASGEEALGNEASGEEALGNEASGEEAVGEEAVGNETTGDPASDEEATGAEEPAPPPVEAAADAASPEAPAADAPPPDAGGDAERAALDARIAQLEGQIAEDEAALSDFISDPGRSGNVRESGELSAIAERLPRLQAELRALRERRAEVAGSDVP